MLTLGKLPPRADARTLKLARYLPERPPVPPACDWSQFTESPWQLYRNDVLGTCTLAAGAHLVQAWSSSDGDEHVIDEHVVLETYSALTGYRPGRPETDRGEHMLKVLKWWRRSGYAGHRIGAFAAIDPRNVDHLRAAIALFGGVYLGLELPRAAEARPWTFAPVGGSSAYARGSWGGHAMAMIGYAERGALLVTHGELRWASWDFVLGYADEAWALIAHDFLGDDGRAPNGLDINTLRLDLSRIAQPTG